LKMRALQKCEAFFYFAFASNLQAES